MTTGTGARTALNTPRTSTKRCQDRDDDQSHTSALNAKQKKTTKIAQHEDPTYRNRLKGQVFLRPHKIKLCPTKKYDEQTMRKRQIWFCGKAIIEATGIGYC